MSIGDDSPSVHDALHQRLDDLRRERDAARAEVDRWKAKNADQAALIQSIDADRDRLVAEVDRLRTLLREVAGSGVESPAEPPGLTYTTVQIDGELWERLRKESGQ